MIINKNRINNLETQFKNQEEGTAIIISVSLFANCFAVVVLPHHFGPTINVAPIYSSVSSNCLSNISWYIFFHNLMLTDYAIYV